MVQTLWNCQKIEMNGKSFLAKILASNFQRCLFMKYQRHSNTKTLVSVVFIAFLLFSLPFYCSLSISNNRTYVAKSIRLDHNFELIDSLSQLSLQVFKIIPLCYRIKSYTMFFMFQAFMIHVFFISIVSFTLRLEYA